MHLCMQCKHTVRNLCSVHMGLSDNTLKSSGLPEFTPIKMAFMGVPHFFDTAGSYCIRFTTDTMPLRDDISLKMR